MRVAISTAGVGVRRVNLLTGVDDVELCNGIGTRRGKHKQCGNQMAVLNLPADAISHADEVAGRLTIGMGKRHGHGGGGGSGGANDGQLPPIKPLEA